MLTDRNIVYYLASAGLFVLLKFGFAHACNDDLIFLLKPADELFSLLSGSPWVYLTDKGFYHENLNIVLDKSCSGFNFWMLSFLVFIHLALRYLHKPLHKILAVPSVLTATYLLVIFVNAFRILAAVTVQKQAQNFLPGYQQVLHEAVGIITNLSFLVLTYYYTEKYLTKRVYHAKPS
ncbi:exosortase K [Flavobacterium cyanobacteriorum]|uniref:Exosortase K n=1 Tax=Flavobacterium cyanobacteriorum TaxID=2022802 RepID=A0A255Z2H4_9FLAO|nr:exosortase K [Flavobacterium cyanobacteriorum]OYQ35678.1 exosortase K [Flavobacterium cyanobacteriorum]